MADNNLVVGKGKIYFQRFADQSQTFGDGTEERFLGNAPTLTITQAPTALDHYASTGGLKEKDRTVTIQNDVSGKMSTDNVSPENLALFWLGDSSLLTVAAAAMVTETITMKPGFSYQLGVSADSPSGARALTLTTAKIDATAVDAASYTFDGDTGRIDVADDAVDITADGVEVVVVYAQLAHTRSLVLAEGQQVFGALRFVADNPVGLNQDSYIPYCKITSDGDFEGIGDDWQTLGFDLEVLKPGGGLAKLYIDGRAAA